MKFDLASLGFTRSQRRGIVLLLALVCLIAGLGWYAGGIRRALPGGPPPAREKWTLFPKKKLPAGPIDINVADSALLATLPGIGPKLSARIVKYRAARGGFKSIEDLQKVYGISDSLFARLAPYLTASPVAGVKQTALQKNYPTLDANLATAGEWALLPGIGPVLSQRIVNYREARKGFRDLKDLEKVYGLPPETLENILPYLTLAPQPPEAAAVQITEEALPANLPSPSETPPKASIAPGAQVDLNHADSLTLVAVPGIGPAAARRILQFRQRWGAFSDPEMLRYLYGVSEENAARALPFLETRPAQAKKTDLNAASAAQLERLPFLSEAERNTLLKNRNALGRFSIWEEVWEDISDPETRRRLKFYAKL